MFVYISYCPAAFAERRDVIRELKLLDWVVSFCNGNGKCWSLFFLTLLREHVRASSLNR